MQAKCIAVKQSIQTKKRKTSAIKLKSIKKFDENGKNADKALAEINHERYGLAKRTGVDYEVFSQNRMSKQPLQVTDKKVFPEQKPRFALGSHDLHKTLNHTGRQQKDRKKPKKKR